MHPPAARRATSNSSLIVHGVDRVRSQRGDLGRAHNARVPGNEVADQLALSVVIVVHDMAREAPRTVTSFSRPYHRDMSDDYEIIIIDNGSSVAYEHTLAGDPPVRVHRMLAPVSRSPARAVNVGVELARGELVCVVVDGARLASPGLLHHALLGARLHAEPLVVTLAWHLGPDEQPRSVPLGYDQRAEDDLLDGIGWPADGYRLFEVSTPAPSSRRGYLLPLPESSALVLTKRMFQQLGGFDERFDQPSGGMVACDFFRRAVLALEGDPVVLVGEGTFHQLHAPPARFPHVELDDRYRALRGEAFAPPPYRPLLLGRPHQTAAPFLARSAVLAARSGESAVTNGAADARSA